MTSSGTAGEARVEGEPDRSREPASRGYTEPAVHWPGNPPIWERPGSPPTLDEAQIRDLVRRELGRRRAD